MLAELSYTERDRVATLRDLIAIQGQMVGIGGQMVRAYVESQTANRQADESGADQFSDEKQVTFETNGVGAVTSETIIRIKDREYTAMVIEPIGETLISLTVDLA